ncbi:MAG TPA: PAS domain S-box protein, partial [Flavisolibacter sp.]|nr:PAS domain S-box protein [Flavisolibacter sp.]
CITGYLYHSIELYQVSNQIPMSFLSAMLFFLISIAVLLTRCEFGFFSLFTKKYIGSKVARILIPVAVIISIVLGVLRLYVEKTNYFSSTLLVAIFAMANLIIFMILIWRCCIYLNKENKAYNLELRKRSIAEEELKTSEQFLNTLIENLPEMIFLKDENLRFVRVNKAAEDTVGILRDQLIGKTDYDFFPTDQADHFTKNDREVFCQNEILVIPEEKIAVRDEIRLLHTKKIVFEGPNQSKYLLGISQDITERKKLDQEIIQLNKDLERKVIERTEQLSRSEKRFRTLIETSSDVITMRDKEGKLVYVSPGIEKLTGYSIAETKTKSLFSLVFPEDQETLFAVYKKVINLPNIPHFYTVRIISKSDEIIWVEGFIVNQLEEEFINAIVSNFKDVTQRKKNEEEKKLLEKHLLDERIDQHKKLILSNIEGQEREKKQIGMELHDNINQVLTSTKLCLEIAESNENLRNAMLLKSKDQLNLAINEIRKLSKTLLPHEKDCGGIIENINEIVQTIHLSTGIHFIIQVEETATNLLDNKEQITVYRIIQEQLNNITKHACATNVSLKLKEKDDCIELLITDDGNGFDINAKRQGIGFANIKNRVESLNGKMLVTSSKGNGCKLEIKIFRND